MKGVVAGHIGKQIVGIGNHVFGLKKLTPKGKRKKEKRELNFIISGN